MKSNYNTLMKNDSLDSEEINSTVIYELPSCRVCTAEIYLDFGICLCCRNINVVDDDLLGAQIKYNIQSKLSV